MSNAEGGHGGFWSPCRYEIGVRKFLVVIRDRVAQLGSAGALGALGRRFESCRPDQLLSEELTIQVPNKFPQQPSKAATDRVGVHGITSVSPLTVVPEITLVKSLRLSFFALGAATLVLACIPEHATAQEPRNLIVGTVDNYLPCSDETSEGYEGLSIDIWRRVAEKLQQPYALVNIPSFSAAIDSAAFGSVDLIASCHKITAERVERVDFSVPYTRASLGILSREDRAINLTFAKKTILEQNLYVFPVNTFSDQLCRGIASRTL